MMEDKEKKVRKKHKLNISIDDVRAFAASKGVKCLSDEYKGGYEKLEWQCSEGHQWLDSFNNVKLRNSWCKECKRINKISTYMERLKTIAESHGGRLISKEYNGRFNRYQWQCKEGHTWFAFPNDVIYSNSWCRKCSSKQRWDKQRLTIEAVQEFAAKKGGKCLSDTYISSKAKMQWQCSEGHIWNASFTSVKNGSWCSKCSARKRGDMLSDNLEMYKKIAIKRKGKCLSDKYLGCRVKLQWQCHEGHTWMAVPNGIKFGTWCPHCQNNSLKLTIKDAKELANKHGGKCLSETYIKENRLKWECAKGHTWESNYLTVKAGFWCKICKREKKLADKKIAVLQK